MTRKNTLQRFVLPVVLFALILGLLMPVLSIADPATPVTAQVEVFGNGKYKMTSTASETDVEEKEITEKGTFEKSFTQPGDYEYKITSEHELETDVYTVKIAVAYDNDDKLVCTVSAYKNDETEKCEKIEFTHEEPTTVKLTVKMVWVDNDDAAGKRPNSITAKLSNNTEMNVTAEGGWTATTAELPRFNEQDEEIQYSWSEPALGDDYELTDTKVEGKVTTFTATLKEEPVTVQVVKVWVDDNNAANERPASLNVKLMANGQESGESVVLSDDNQWTEKIENLPRSSEGNEIQYTWSEEDVGTEYSMTDYVTDDQNVTTITNTYSSTKTSSTVMIVWNDNNNEENVRPGSVVVKLSNGQEVTLGEQNGWTATVSNLPKTNDAGEPIAYTWTQPDLGEHYALSNTDVNGNVTTFTNTLIPTKISVTVQKVWDDNNNEANERPGSLMVKLLANDQETGDTVVLAADNQWTGTVSDVLKFSGGNPIRYTWVEEDVGSEYSMTNYATNENVTTITNTYRSTKTSSSVMKIWNDNNNEEGVRPASVLVKLSNGQEVYLTEASNWTATIEDLPKYNDAGEEIVYTWTEPELNEHYTLSNVDVNGSLTTFTNTLKKPTVSLSVQKVWDDNNNAKQVRPASLMVRLYADGQDLGNAVILNEENDWFATIENLPESKSGVPITYSWAEETVGNNYSMTGYKVDGNITTITNTYVQEEQTTSATVVKGWSDYNNVDNIRPASLVVTLSNGQKVTLNEANSWTATINNLPKYKDGVAINYTWQEDPVPGYEQTNMITTGTTTYITNTHTPETISLTVKKVWDDNNNANKSRPASVSVSLSNGQTVILTAVNGWSATLEGLPKYQNGKEIAYTWTEAVPANYKQTKMETSGNTTVITNQYINSGSTPIPSPSEKTPCYDDPPVMKTVTGTNDVSAMFRFSMKARLMNYPMPDGSVAGEKTVTRNGPGPVEFGTIRFTAPGTYEYEITELNTGINGYIYDTNTYAVRYVVTESGNRLVSTRSFLMNGNVVPSMTQVVISNTYNPNQQYPYSNIQGKTGDSSNMTAFVILACSALMVMGTVSYIVLKPELAKKKKDR